MSIINRNLHRGQNRDIFQMDNGTVTGQTYTVAGIPYAGFVVTANMVCVGLSGSPNHSLWLQRFIAGSGVTSINLGASLVAQAFGTSGSQQITFNGANVTFPVIAGDVVILSTAAANTATVQTTIELVVECTQDYKFHWGF